MKSLPTGPQSTGGARLGCQDRATGRHFPPQGTPPRAVVETQRPWIVHPLHVVDSTPTTLACASRIVVDPTQGPTRAGAATRRGELVGASGAIALAAVFTIAEAAINHAAIIAYLEGMVR